MRIGLIDVDGHNFPNLPLMKISAYHKAQGDVVEWYEPFKALAEGEYDKVYMSKVFSFTPDYTYPVYAKEVHKGGTGYAIKLENNIEVFHAENDTMLPDEIEHQYPDYNLYGITDTAYDFLTRGCPRGCEFCHVKAKEGARAYKVADLKEFWSGQSEIVLNDPNILACKDHIELLEQLAESGATVEFNQGLDVRLITERNLEVLRRIKLKRIHFAYDRYKDKELVEAKLKAFKEATNYGRDKIMVYILTNFETTIPEDIERIQFVRSLGYQPYVTIYNKRSCDKAHRELQRWCNPYIFWKCATFEEYKNQRKGKQSNGEE